MITIRGAQERGHFDHGWLNTYHTFSFADYHDPRFMGFRTLRVINEDRVEPGRGFGTHGHRDMEIISYVVSGALGHRDSLGTGSVIRPGDVQRMSAGTGVLHSEMNASDSEPVHFLQIWILPAERGIAPGYEQKRFEDEERRGRLRVVVSPDGRDGSLTIHQDVTVYAAALIGGKDLTHPLAQGRAAWVQVIRGSVDVNEHPLAAGDGAAVEQVESVMLAGDGEILLFDLA